MPAWYPAGTGYGDSWVQTGDYKLRYQLDDDGDLQRFLLAPIEMSDDDAHQNHVDFWYSASQGCWASAAKFRDPRDNKLHRLKDLSLEDALWICKNLTDR